MMTIRSGSAADFERARVLVEQIRAESKAVEVIRQAMRDEQIDHTSAAAQMIEAANRILAAAKEFRALGGDHPEEA